MRVGALVLTCEHGGNRVPADYARLFTSRRARAALASHRGYDPGALPLARSLARRFGVPLLYSEVTRLLVELNRSIGHRALFSEFAAGLGRGERERVLGKYYFPHRGGVEEAIRRQVQEGRGVLHIAVHSFAPRLRGHTRTADVGLLYDPRRAGERGLCAQWKTILAAGRSELRVRRNYPYRGCDDGLTTYLRRVFDPREYIGVELEMNQALLRERDRGLVAAVADSLGRVLDRAGDHLERRTV